MTTDTPNTVDHAATTTVLTYLQQQITKLGDRYTADLIASLTASQSAGTLTSTAALKIVAALLAHEDQAAAHEAAREAARNMAIEALANEIDLLFGRNHDVSVRTAHARLQQEGAGVPRRRVADALMRRRQRNTPGPVFGEDGTP
jgi:hypothetical protein